MTLPDIHTYATMTKQQIDDLFVPTLQAATSGEITAEERQLRARVAVTCKNILYYQEEIAIMQVKLACLLSEMEVRS
jgi:hypothetical protein